MSVHNESLLSGDPEPSFRAEVLMSRESAATGATSIQSRRRGSRASGGRGSKLYSEAKIGGLVTDAMGMMRRPDEGTSSEPSMAKIRVSVYLV